MPRAKASAKPAPKKLDPMLPRMINSTPPCGLQGWCPVAHDHQVFHELGAVLEELGLDRDEKSSVVNLILRVWCKGHSRHQIPPDLSYCHDVQRKLASPYGRVQNPEAMLASQLRRALEKREKELKEQGQSVGADAYQAILDALAEHGDPFGNAADGGTGGG